MVNEYVSERPSLRRRGRGESDREGLTAEPQSRRAAEPQSRRAAEPQRSQRSEEIRGDFGGYVVR